MTALVSYNEEQTVKVLLCCTSALTTSYFAEQLNNAAKILSLNYIFEAVSYDRVYEKGLYYDIILLAPQIGFQQKKIHNAMFIIAVLSHLTWAAAGAVGCCFGSMLPFELKGIDFCMTALFVTILIDQWRSVKDHFPALCGLSAAVILCIVLGPDRFILPSLAAVSAVLLWRRTVTKEKIC